MRVSVEQALHIIRDGRGGGRLLLLLLHTSMCFGVVVEESGLSLVMVTKRKKYALDELDVPPPL